MSLLSSSSTLFRLVRSQQQQCVRLPTTRTPFNTSIRSRKNSTTTTTNGGTSSGSSPSSSSSSRQGYQQSSKQTNQQQQQQRRNIFSRFNDWYFEKLETHPLWTKCLTGGIIAGCGDIICQFGTRQNELQQQPQQKEHEDTKQEDKQMQEVSFWKDIYDPMRTVHFFIMGSCFASPLNHFWYNYLQSAFGGQTFVQITTRVVLDQFLWCPAWTVVWLACFWTMEGSEPQDIPQGLQENYVGIITANWYLWIPAQYINFYAIPLQYKVLYTNFVELIWNAYLSFATALDDDDNSSRSDTKKRTPLESSNANDESDDDDDDEKAKEKNNQQDHDDQRRRKQTLHRNRTFR